MSAYLYYESCIHAMQKRNISDGERNPLARTISANMCELSQHLCKRNFTLIILRPFTIFPEKRPGRKMRRKLQHFSAGRQSGERMFDLGTKFWWTICLRVFCFHISIFCSSWNMMEELEREDKFRSWKHFSFLRRSRIQIITFAPSSSSTAIQSVRYLLIWVICLEMPSGQGMRYQN